MSKFDLDQVLSELGLESEGESRSSTPQQPGSSAEGEPPRDPFTSIYDPESEGGSEPLADLGQALLQRGVISSEQYNVAERVLRQSPGHRLVDVLLEQEVDEEAIQRVVAERSGLAFERIDPERIDEQVDNDLFKRLTPGFCKDREILPLRMQNKRLTLGAVRPDDVFLLDDIRRRLNVANLRVVVITRRDIAAVLDHFGESQEDVNLDEILGDIDEDDVEVQQEKSDDKSIDLEQQAGESPVIRYVNYILQSAVKEGASDVHVEPGEHKLKVRFRIDGVLFDMLQPPKSMAAALVSRLKIMADLDISERRLPQDGRIRATVQRRRLDLRLSTLPTPHGEKCVLRLLDERSIAVELDELGFDENTLRIWKNQITEPHGVALVTGPTGSGKTTTLYASLRMMDKQRLNISAVEDPIEYHMEGITQTQVHTKIDMSFARALKALLRQDPDVIMLGEIRDLETAHTAVQAALTGHLVLATLHTNDAPSSITRLINIGVDPFLVGAGINGVLAQRLVRRICQHCKDQTKPTGELAEFLEINSMPADAIWIGQGCDKCRGTGYSGRVGLYELLDTDDHVRDMIARNPNVSEFRRMCIERGMVTLRQDGLAKAAQGQTTVQEVLRVTESAT